MCIRDSADSEQHLKNINNLAADSKIVIDFTNNHPWIYSINKDGYLSLIHIFTPYEIYLKFLLEYFGKSIDFDPNSVSDLPMGYKKDVYKRQFHY